MVGVAPSEAKQGGVSRRGLLVRAAIAVAAAAGLGVALQRRLAGQPGGPAPLQLDEDSIFLPRADQRERVLGKK